jgi:tRNA(adenine34) deaminase
MARAACGIAWRARALQDTGHIHNLVAINIILKHILFMPPIDHQYFMEQALREAQKAFEESEVPVGAVVVHRGIIIGRGHNRTEALKDATAHAEMLAITSAAEHIGDWRLEEAVLYCTIEPCAMCAGAAVLSRIKTIVYGAKDIRFGACGTIFEVPTDKRLNHRIEIISGVMEKEATELMQIFFKEVRRRKEKIN